METEFGERPNAGAFIPIAQSEAVASGLQELSLQSAPNLLPVRERKDVLQLKLQQRRSREELVNQGIMPPLKSSAAFHEHRRSLERARTEDYLKRKIRARPERSDLIRMHILEETSAEPSLQAKQLQLKRSRLADDLNDKISHRPGPMELIHKNILPVHSSIKRAIIETQFPKASGDNSSCDEDSNYSLSPEQPVSRESPLGLLPLPSPPEVLSRSSIPSPAQVSPPAPTLPPISGPSLFKLNNGTAAAASSTHRMSQVKSQPKPTCDRSAQRHKKPKDNKPKIKKLKYHQYIPPDQKGDKEPPPHLDSSYAKILQQQQLFLQLQILSQQQQHYNYQAILPAPPKPQTDQHLSSSSSSHSTTASSPPQSVAAPPTAPSNPASHNHHNSAVLRGAKPASLPPNLDEMKVAELKSELKLRSLPVSGTKNDLIERLKTYQELNGGSDSTSSPTAGGTTRPGPEGAGKACKTAVTSITSLQQFQYQSHQTSSVIADAGGSAAHPEQLMTCGGTVSPPPSSPTPPDRSLGSLSPEDSSFSSNPLEEMMSLQPRSAAQLETTIKVEPECSTPVPCQFSLKPASLKTHCQVSPAALTATATVPVVSMDKDRMLQEKDKQIEELTRMLRQKQRLVEVLRMQLEHGNKGGPEPMLVVKVKQEPSDKPSGPLSLGHKAFPPPPSSISCEMDVIKVTVKQEAIEEEEVVPESKMHLPEAPPLLQSSTQTQEAQEQIQPQTRPEQMSTQTKQQRVHLQQTTMQLAQQQTIQKLLLQQQHNIQSRSQTPENLQKVSQQRKKKSHKLQLKHLQQQQQLLLPQQQNKQSKQHQQQMQLKQQILLKQQTKQLQQIQIQTKIHVKQQQVLLQQKQQEQQQPPQVSQASFKEQSGSAPAFPLDLLKNDSTPTLVTDSNGNHFLIALTSHLTENQTTDSPESKASKQIALQRLQSTPAKLSSHNVQLPKADAQTKHGGVLKQQQTKPQNGELQLSTNQPQQPLCLSAPPSLQPFLQDQEVVPSGKNTLSPSSESDLCPSLDVLFSPLSPASIKTAASSPDNKDTEHEVDFIDIILQTGEMSTTLKPAPNSPLNRLNPRSSSSPLPSPLQLLLSPPTPPNCDPPPSVHSVQSELRPLSDTIEVKEQLRGNGTGRLEDFLESTTGKPLLGVEPGGLLTLIDDLHSQMLCTPSILDHPLSPMDTFDVAVEGEHGFDGMDWLDITMEGARGVETPTLAPLCPQTPPSVFSTDFLESSDLQIHWDSCL